ncbi:MAG: helix-turn-helix domain-containing protein [Bryobacteraceae bacterium]
MKLKLLSIPTVAALLQRSESCIRRLVKRKIIPSVRVGRAVRVEEKKLRSWIDAGGGGEWKFLQPTAAKKTGSRRRAARTITL